MIRTGLKLQITLTLTLLLGTAMVLAGFVMTVFWQRSLIKAEAKRIHDILECVTANAKRAPGEPTALPDILAAPDYRISRLNADCLIFAQNNVTRRIIDTSCAADNQLASLVQSSRKSQENLVRTSGTVSGFPTRRPGRLLVAIPTGDRVPASALGISTPLAPVYGKIREARKALYMYLLLNAIFLVAIGFFRLVTSTVKPVERLVTLAEQYDITDDYPLAAENPGGEFGQLTASLNRMIRKIEQDRHNLRETIASLEATNAELTNTRKEMLRTENLATVGRLSAGLAHEIGNPLGIIQGYLELLNRETLDPASRRDFVKRAQDELGRVNNLIRQLLDFSRTSPRSHEQVSGHDLLKEIITLFRQRRNMHSISFRAEFHAANDTVAGDREGLRQVLVNCLLNAADAIQERGRDFPGEISIATRNETADAGDQLLIIISDNGVGIPPAQLNNIFDPFFTTKEPGRGTGLGLSVSLSIVESVGGTITAGSQPGKGTEISIILPQNQTGHADT